MACVAWPTCGLSITEAERALPGVIDELEVELARLGLSSETFTVRMTGCPNGCARPYNSDIGLVGKAAGKYTVFLGGRLLGNRLNVNYKDMVPAEELVSTLVPVFAYFKQDREPDETFGDFCHRKGMADLLDWTSSYAAQAAPSQSSDVKNGFESRLYSALDGLTQGWHGQLACPCCAAAQRPANLATVSSLRPGRETRRMPLRPWMKYLLWFVGGYNILAGLGMMIFYHEGFRILDLPKPELMLPLQLVGMLVGLFGVGYWLVAWNPVENRNVLTLGFFSKFLGSLLGIAYLALGKMPLVFLPVLFFADIIYLPPFLLIMRRLYRWPRDVQQMATGAPAIDSRAA